MTDPTRALLEIARGMQARRLSVGSAGNVSLRTDSGFIITPSGMPPTSCASGDMVAMTLAGAAQGRYAPSSEWRMHRDIYAARHQVNAIVHAHAPFATALACHRRAIPSFHYMIARFGGDSIRCADYATFGTQALSDAVLAALAERSACLMANHGMIVLSASADAALESAEEFEMLCEHFWRACALGEPALLNAAQMREALDNFSGYGHPRLAASDTGSRV